MRLATHAWQLVLSETDRADIERSWEARRSFKGSAPSGLPAQQINICGSYQNLQNSALTVYIENDRLHPIASFGIDGGLLPAKQNFLHATTRTRPFDSKPCWLVMADSGVLDISEV